MMMAGRAVDGDGGGSGGASSAALAVSRGAVAPPDALTNERESGSASDSSVVDLATDSGSLFASAATMNDSDAEENDDNEWEDVGYEPVFRDLKYFSASGENGDDEDDSEYAPSDNDDNDDALEEEEEEELRDLAVEEEEASPAGLFASVVRQFRSKRASVDALLLTDPVSFDAQDAEVWATVEEKQRWVERLQAANQRHVLAYGCRIDAPALPEATSQLRRETKQKSVYTLVLFALCVAYFVQLIVTYASTGHTTIRTVQEVVESVKTCARAIPTPGDVYRRVLELDVITDAEDSERLLEDELELDTVTREPVVDADKAAAVEPADVAGSVDVALHDTDADTEVESDESAAVAVHLCAKFLTRLVKSKYDAIVKAAAMRACDAAVAMAPQDSTYWIEAHVLRGDLSSLVTAFSSAADDYNVARASAVLHAAAGGRSEQLPVEIQLKIVANDWIRLFATHGYKELRQQAARVTKDASASAALRALAHDWLRVFKKTTEPFDALTATRLRTFERLVYA